MSSPVVTGRSCSNIEAIIYVDGTNTSVGFIVVGRKQSIAMRISGSTLDRRVVGIRKSLKVGPFGCVRYIGTAASTQMFPRPGAFDNHEAECMAARPIFRRV